MQAAKHGNTAEHAWQHLTCIYACMLLQGLYKQAVHTIQLTAYACVRAHLHAYIPACIRACMHVCMHQCLQGFMSSHDMRIRYMFVRIMHTCLHASVPVHQCLPYVSIFPTNSKIVLLNGSQSMPKPSHHCINNKLCQAMPESIE